MSKVKRGAESNYSVLDVPGLVRLGPLVQEVCEDDAVLALWFVSSQVGAALSVMEAWGFEQKQVWTWVKTTKIEPLDKVVRRAARAASGKGPYSLTEVITRTRERRLAFGMGHLARNCTENLLVGVRGKVYGDVVSHSERNAFQAPATKHSVKPPHAHEMLDAMFPGEPGLELFARRDMEGWTTLGAECPSDGLDIWDSLRSLCSTEHTVDERAKLILSTPKEQ